jgi:hypothetical protein
MFAEANMTLFAEHMGDLKSDRAGCSANEQSFADNACRERSQLTVVCRWQGAAIEKPPMGHLWRQSSEATMQCLGSCVRFTGQELELGRNPDQTRL